MTRAIVIILRTVAALLGAWIGVVVGHVLGEAFVYAIAALTDRDIASLEDMLIWSVLTGAAIAAIACVWLALFLTRASRGARRAALIALAGAVLCGTVLMLATYDWPKSSGVPVVDYELRLPPGSALPARSDIDVTVWSAKSGQGCYIDGVHMADGRPEITGHMVLHPTSAPRTLALQLKGVGEGHWDLPIGPEPKLERTFGPWRRIEFLPPRGDVVPLAPGGYDIRYRVRSYL
jgi:hypothetical protein